MAPYNTHKREMGTQTNDNSPADSGKTTRTRRSSDQSSLRSVRTVVRMKGYPSARVRHLKPSNYVSPMPSPKRQITHPVPRTADAKPKIDNKGINLFHALTPVKINHKLPRTSGVKSRIDNRGVDIYKWRNSMVNLRNIVDPLDVTGGRKVSSAILQYLKYVPVLKSNF